MFRWIFFFIVLFKTYFGLAQVGDSMELQRQMIRVEALSNRNYDSTIALSIKVRDDAIKLNLQKIAWDASIYMADAYNEISKKDSAENILLNLLDTLISLDERIYQIRIYSKLAELYADNSRFDESIESLIAAEKLLEYSDEFELRFDILNNLAITHRKMKDYSSAISILDSLWQNNYFQMDTIQRFHVINNLGIVYASESMYEKAISYFSQAYEIIKEVDNPENLSRIAYNLGVINYRLKKYDKSIEYINKALPAYEKMNDKNGIENCYRNLAAIQIDLKKFDKAEQLSFQALEIAKEIGDKKKMLGNYRNLYLLYSKLKEGSKDYQAQEMELEYFRNWAFLKDSLYQTEMTDKIFELEKQYETEKKNNQISLLEKDNQIKEDEIRFQQNQRNSLVLYGILISGVLAIFIYAYNRNRKLNRLLQAQSKRIVAQNQKIFDQNEKLQKAIKTRDKLFSIIAHDLRSPLTSIANFSKLIGFYLRDNKVDSVVEVAKDLEQKNNYVLELTDNLLTWARSQSEDLDAQFDKVSIREITEECLDIYSSVSQEKSIELNLLEKEDCLLWADRNMVKTILRNLINNAIKFTPEKGEISISYQQVNSFVEICVADNGIGMSAEQGKNLFDSNKQEVRRGTNGEKSSGLGLSICKEFTTALNGTINAECAECEGCKIYVMLPAYQGKTIKDQAATELVSDFSNLMD